MHDGDLVRRLASLCEYPGDGHFRTSRGYGTRREHRPILGALPSRRPPFAKLSPQTARWRRREYSGAIHCSITRRPRRGRHTTTTRGVSCGASFITAGLALAVGAGFACSAIAQVKPETLVDQRVAAMRLQGKYLYPLIPMAQGRVPYDANIVARNAGYLDVLIKMPWDGFDPVDQGREEPRAAGDLLGSGEIQSRAGQMSAEMSKFQAPTKTGNEANIKTAIVDRQQGLQQLPRHVPAEAAAVAAASASPSSTLAAGLARVACALALLLTVRERERGSRRRCEIAVSTSRRPEDASPATPRTRRTRRRSPAAARSRRRSARSTDRISRRTPRPESVAGPKRISSARCATACGPTARTTTRRFRILRSPGSPTRDLADLWAYLRTLPPEPATQPAARSSLPVPLALCHRGVELAVLHARSVRERPAAPASRRPRRLSRRGARPLRRMPHAAQFPRRDEKGSCARRRERARPARTSRI